MSNVVRNLFRKGRRDLLEGTVLLGSDRDGGVWATNEDMRGHCLVHEGTGFERRGFVASMVDIFARTGAGVVLFAQDFEGCHEDLEATAVSLGRSYDLRKMTFYGRGGMDLFSGMPNDHVAMALVSILPDGIDGPLRRALVVLLSAGGSATASGERHRWTMERIRASLSDETLRNHLDFEGSKERARVAEAARHLLSTPSGRDEAVRAIVPIFQRLERFSAARFDGDGPVFDPRDIVFGRRMTTVRLPHDQNDARVVFEYVSKSMYLAVESEVEGRHSDRQFGNLAPRRFGYPLDRPALLIVCHGDVSHVQGMSFMTGRFRQMDKVVVVSHPGGLEALSDGSGEASIGAKSALGNTMVQVSFGRHVDGVSPGPRKRESTVSVGSVKVRATPVHATPADVLLPSTPDAWIVWDEGVGVRHHTKKRRAEEFEMAVTRLASLPIEVPPCEVLEVLRSALPATTVKGVVQRSFGAVAVASSRVRRDFGDLIGASRR